MDKKGTILIVGIIIILIGLFTLYYAYYNNVENDSNICELERDLENGMSIMGIWPHPDDEVYTPGIFLYAADKGNTCWVIHLIGLDYVPPQAQGARAEAIQWFRETYLWPNGGDCINLNMSRGKGISGWHGWAWSNETIKAAIKAQIEEKKPDILLTFSPYGYCDLIEHGLISNIVTDISDELDYEPKIYWFINTDQGPRSDPCYEHEEYTPTDILNLDIYSDVLRMTFWEAKIDFWEHYAPSVGALNGWIQNPENLENNDRNEYYLKYE